MKNSKGKGEGVRVGGTVTVVKVTTYPATLSFAIPQEYLLPLTITTTATINYSGASL